MVPTVMIHDSGGKVLAPLCGGTFIEGKRKDILVIAPPDDEDIPRAVREELVGVKLSTIFNSTQLGGRCPQGSRVAYASDVAEALREANKPAAAQALMTACTTKDPDSEHHFVVFKSNEYRFANAA